jgi:CopG antitoxin of type II toxin-antitoxin system
MPNRGKHVDPIPNEFARYEDAAEFWDTHDTTDYPDAFQSVKVEEVALRQRRYEVEIDEDVIIVLREQARQRALPVSRLVNDLLRQHLLPTSSSPSS